MKILRLRFTTAVDGEEHELDLRPILDASSCVLELPPGTTAQLVVESAAYALHGTPAAGVDRVALEIALGEDTYRVARRAGEAALWRVPPGTSEGQPVASSGLEVTSEIEILLGYTEQELRQVVLLAQREFGGVLDATPIARVDLLEGMLEREIHRRVDQELGQVAEGKEEGSRDSRDVILRLVTALLEPRRSEAYTFQELAAQREALDASLAAVTAGLERLKHAEERAARLLDDAERRPDSQRELAEAEAAVAALEAQRADVERWRRLLRVARPADALATPLADALAHAAACERRALAAQEQARGALEEARTARAALAAEQTRDPERDAARRDVESFESLQRAIAARDEARSVAERAEAAAVRDEQRRDEIGSRLADAQRQLVEEEQVRPESDVDPEELAQIRAEHAEAAAALARVQRVESLRVELRDAARMQGRAKTRLADVEERIDRARRDRLRRVGSPPGLHADEEQGGVDELSAEAEALRDQEAASASRILQVRTELRALMDEVGLLAYDTLLVEGRARLAQERLDRLSAGEARVLQAAESTARLRAECLRLRDQMDLAERDFKSSRGERDTARAALARAESGLPDPLLGAEAVGEATRRARERLLILGRSLADAEGAATRAADTLAQREQLVRSTREAERDAARRVEELRGSRTRKLADAGLSAEDERLLASADPGELSRREQQVGQFEADCQAAQERVRRAREGRGRPRPSVPQVEQLLAQVRDAVAHVERQEVVLAERLGRLDDVDDLAVQLSEVDDVWEVVRRIAEVARGRNPVGQTFQRFVLSGLLDDLLDLATRRLRRMTRGRFHLQRRTTPEQWHVSDRIEIELHDAIAGSVHAAESLSEEDSFRSSLALALAFADLVQAGAGGVRIDTLLLDGTNGAWSGDALASVIEALSELHAAGRSIAILTTDPSLRERAARLRESRLTS